MTRIQLSRMFVLALLSAAVLACGQTKIPAGAAATTPVPDGGTDTHTPPVPEPPAPEGGMGQPTPVPEPPVPEGGTAEPTPVPEPPAQEGGAGEPTPVPEPPA